MSTFLCGHSLSRPLSQRSPSLCLMPASRYFRISKLGPLFYLWLRPSFHLIQFSSTLRQRLLCVNDLFFVASCFWFFCRRLVYSAKTNLFKPHRIAKGTVLQRRIMTWVGWALRILTITQQITIFLPVLNGRFETGTYLSQRWCGHCQGHGFG